METEKQPIENHGIRYLLVDDFGGSGSSQLLFLQATMHFHERRWWTDHWPRNSWFRCNEASGAVHDPKRYRRPWVNRRFLHCAVKIGLHFYLHFPRNAFAEHLKVRCY